MIFQLNPFLRYKTMFSDDRTKWWVLLVWLSAPMLYLAFLLSKCGLRCLEQRSIGSLFEITSFCQ